MNTPFDSSYIISFKCKSLEVQCLSHIFPADITVCIIVEELLGLLVLTRNVDVGAIIPQ